MEGSRRSCLEDGDGSAGGEQGRKGLRASLLELPLEKCIMQTQPSLGCAAHS